MNKVVLIGNLSGDPALRNTNSGLAVCSFSIAVNRQFKKSDEVDFIPITVWGVSAENCNKYLKKGSKVAVSGSLRVRKYDAQDGTRRTAFEVNADEVQFLTSKGTGAGDASDDYNDNRDIDELTPVENSQPLPF